ncbi:MAG: hypothetical protein ACXWFC_08450, partial [Nitrososphaeraceae archaeon]
MFSEIDIIKELLIACSIKDNKSVDNAGILLLYYKISKTYFEKNITINRYIEIVKININFIVLFFLFH